MGRAHLDALGETITLWAKLIDTLRETITLWVEKQSITLVEIIDSFFRNIRDSRGVKWKETTWHARTVATPKGGCLLICVHQHIHSSMEIKALVWEVPILRGALCTNGLAPIPYSFAAEIICEGMVAEESFVVGYSALW
ncbi:hypothetical protein V6N12_032234 [Hibiscus sabdariffa]|uniref:Uncharacterized protein n=1 Tax=Hibiscus sabdariffa TaxID=183260 RepID=A0ABR2CC12_9ROSI